MDAPSSQVVERHPVVVSLRNRRRGDPVAREQERQRLLAQWAADGIPIQNLVPAGFTVDGIYRSGFPTIEHLNIYEVLGINTVISLTSTDYPRALEFWMARTPVRMLHYPMHNDRWGVDALYDTVDFILERMMPTHLHPLVFHCEDGDSQAACIVGCFRKLQGWDDEDIIQEYCGYAGTHFGSQDEVEFILNYEPSLATSQQARWAGVANWEPREDWLTSRVPASGRSQ
ncbi:hypothetical protein N7492_002991 [Penicillium capsulatum]|uniref:Tyrosine specific protein phosphatases domain-containing protein n=1 Tax=Penicillium capsulatum TaxID=69766 RepID=A0A9W9IMC3_9EURO|nr:hypothetical protein N7492_002991 [Penicillium capsulatum]KAJ6122418.1 hypothetical protein N7512_004883 [Penicillium capsulatum]